MKNRQLTPLTLLALIAAALFAFALTSCSEGFSATDEHDHEQEGEHDLQEATGHDDDGDNDDSHAGETADEHAGETEDEHAGETEEDHATGLDIEALQKFGAEIATASQGELWESFSVNGEILINEEKMAHVVPRLGGVTISIAKMLGEEVRAGGLLAVLESRELAELKASYLSAEARLNLAVANWQREEALWKKEITSEQEYLEAKNEMTDAEITLMQATEILKATGISAAEIKKLKENTSQSLAAFNLVAPLAGIITEKHITLGESIGAEEPAFIITDTSSVWVELSIYQKDLGNIHVAQEVAIPLEDGGLPVVGKISFISPIFNHETRMATARIVMDNKDGRLKPGQFIKANIQVKPITAAVVVPKTAVVNLDGEIVIFALHDDEIEERIVVLGSSDDLNVEIISGLEAGERYVAVGGFTIKSEMDKDSFAHAGHGH
jgi:cobalt-zinc-cadmium efflux system membrane fusion protein